MSKQAWIGVDLDGTLAKYDGWNDGKIGEPVPLMLERVKKWIGEGKQVKIFTARVSVQDPPSLAGAIKDIEEWCVTHLRVVLPVTCCKDFAMVELWDDRCIQVEANTGRIVH